MAGLFLLLAECKPVQAALLGLLFGLGWFSAGFWWVFPGLNKFSEAGTALSLLLCAALVLTLALFPALFGAAIGSAARRCRLRTGPACWGLYAALWTWSEWARGNLFGGMPMLTTGYAHASSPLGCFAPLVGVYGITFINAGVAAMLADCLPRFARGWRHRYLMLCSLLALGITCLLLQDIEWTRDSGRKLTVRLAQGNLPQFDKYTGAGLRRALSTYSTIAGSSSAQLTVFPETALPLEWFSLPPVILAGWKELARERRSAIVIGAIVASPPSNGPNPVLTNSALVLLPDSTSATYDYRYDKMHLVPVAERAVPGGEWIYGRLGSHFSTLWPGTPGQPPLTLDGARIAFSICFESLFDTAIAAKAKTAQLLVNTSNFAWFDGTYAAAEHLQSAQMRALETGRWFLQAANSGQTAIIDQHGVIQQRLPAEVMGVLDGEVRLFDGQTPFMVVGNWPLLLVSGLLCGWLALPACVATARRIGRRFYPTTT